jgi:2-keto-4-pentenoate hydratase/2-oxohepta-3-ene-1,7-dioic acid hydratase in catechol pathway
MVSYLEGGVPGAGILTDAGVIPAAATMRALLSRDEATDLDGATPLPLDQLQLTAPVTDPEKIVCIGLNYRSHAEEAGLDPPGSPTIFGKYRNALAGPGATVALPRASEKVDYEAEVAVVVGRRAANIDEDAALDAVAGYMLLNDLSARDLQFATPQWMAGKVFDGSAPCGPALVTPDEAGAHDAISFALDLNGERMQEASTDDLIFSVPQLIAHLSTLMTLEPGDIISTGTPSGVGSTRKPRVWLKPGDEIVISSPTLGELKTLIA